jgi:hypothetical protein
MNIHCLRSKDVATFNAWVQLTEKNSLGKLLCPNCQEAIEYRLYERNLPPLSPCERSIRTSIRYWGHILSFELKTSKDHTAQFNTHNDQLHLFPSKPDTDFDIHPMLLQRVIFPYISKLDEEPRAPYIDAEVRTMAVRLVGSINLQTLNRTLNGDDSNMKLLALAELRRIGEPEAVTAIMKALNDDNSQVRRYAVTLLGKTDDSRAVKAVSKRFKDSDARVRLAAGIALERLKK